MKTQRILAVVLAAGHSTRFKAATNKLLMPLCGRPLVFHPLKALWDNSLDITIVVGNHTNYLKQTVLEWEFAKNITFAYQKNPLGTGDALLKTKDKWSNYDQIFVVNGDMPLLSNELIQSLIAQHTSSQATASLVCSNVLNPLGYGRIIEDHQGLRIVEEKDCSPAQKAITKINAGVYIFERSFLENAIHSLTNNNASAELYITDLIGMAAQTDRGVSIVNAPFELVQGVNTIQEFWLAEQTLKKKIISQWMAQGVIFENPHNLHIDIDVIIGQHAKIGSGAVLLRGSHIGENCTISSFSILANAFIDSETIIKSHTVIQDSLVGKQCNIGPFSRVRNNCVIKDNVTIENFSEINRCTLEQSVHVHQMCYLEEKSIPAHAKVSHPVQPTVCDINNDIITQEFLHQKNL